MSAVQSIYSWPTPQGTLDLLSGKKGYAFSLTINNTQVRIPVTQSHSCLFAEAQNVANVCENYFPTLNQNQGREWTVTFDLSASPDIELPNQQEKSMGNFNFAFNSLENKKQIGFSKTPKTAPAYRRVTSGLNMQGECTNTKCVAIGKTVFIQKGMGTFNAGQLKHKSNCPACHEKIPPEKLNNLGFWNCKYEIEGQRADKEDSFSEKEIAVKEHYTTFVPGDDCAWEYMQIITAPIQAPAPEMLLPPPANRSCVIL